MSSIARDKSRIESLAWVKIAMKILVSMSEQRFIKQIVLYLNGIDGVPKIWIWKFEIENPS